MNPNLPAAPRAGEALESEIARSVALVQSRLGARVPRIGLVLGTGWNGARALLEAPSEFAYADLPGFPALGVGGHAGRLVVGRVGRHEVALLAGRQHGYETGAVDGMAGAIRTLAALGVRVLVQTNAAGSLDLALRPGETMLVADHLNIVQRSPLEGAAGDDRFVDLTHAYDPLLRQRAKASAAAAGLLLHEGVYAWVLGPQFETPAEIRWLRHAGAQAVGMSTVPETILARHAGLRVLALSLITNMAAGIGDEALGHAQTLAAADAAAERAVRLLRAVLEGIEP